MSDNLLHFSKRLPSKVFGEINVLNAFSNIFPASLLFLYVISGSEMNIAFLSY